jgi:DNA primase
MSNGTKRATTIELSRLDIEHLPNHKKSGTRRFTSACPFCGEGKDRFVFWPNKGNYWCNHCHAKGFITEANTLTIDEAKYDAWKRAEEKRAVKERLAKMSALDRLAATDNANRYHHLMESRLYWYNQGLNDETINKHKLGYCPACPTYKESPSHTIPITYNPGWFTVLVEGEVKSMVLTQAGFDAVGTPGKSSFKEKWAALFEKCGLVFVAFDPDADEQSEVRICKLPTKPDDFLVKYGGSPAELFRFLMLGKKV